jgi:hypothetical protein
MQETDCWSNDQLSQTSGRQGHYTHNWLTAPLICSFIHSLIRKLEQLKLTPNFSQQKSFRKLI